MAVLSRRKGSPKPYYYKFVFQGKMIRGYGFQDKAEAKLAEAQERVKLAALTNSSAWIILVDKRLQVVQAYATPLWYATCKSYLTAFNDWAALPAETITAEMVRDKILEIARVRGNKVANRHLVICKAVFYQAVRDNNLARNPAINIAMLPIERARKTIPKREDIDKVLALAPLADRAYLETVLFTGARVGEINNLTWEDVDFERRTLRLWTKKKRGSNRRYRTVHMIERVYNALMSRYDTYCNESRWVFTNPTNGKGYIYRDKFLKTLCRRAGVPEFTYHHLRHYAASALAAAGVPIPTIQKILGHERAETTGIYLQDLGQAETALEILTE